MPITLCEAGRKIQMPMRRWREQPHVGKIEIQRDQDPLLLPASLDQFPITAAGEILREYRMAIVTGVME